MKIKTLKLNRIFFTHSLLIILIGVFLLPNVAYFSSITEKNIIDLTNQERLQKNLKPLQINKLLTDAAYKKGLNILENQTFAHTINEKKFSTWIHEAGYEYLYSGENLAIDFLTAEGAINAWMRSESHQKNILNSNFQEIGVAIVEGKFEEHNSIIIVQIFGSPIPETKKEENTPILNIYNNYTTNAAISTNQINNENILNRSTIKPFVLSAHTSPLKILSKNILIFTVALSLITILGIIETIYMFPYKKYKIKRKKAKIKR